MNFHLNIRYCLFILFALMLNSIPTQAQEQIWNRHVIDSALTGADGVRLADVNGDNLMDIATGWEEGGYTKVYLHPGPSLVRKKWPSVIVGRTPSVEDAVFADLNDDGAIDVVSSTEGKNKKIYLNWAPKDPVDYLDSSKWNTQVLPASDGLMQWMFALPVDLDGKNGIDIIAGAKNREAKIGWFEAPLNSMNLPDWKWHPISEATWVMSLMVSDMDNDGDPDIVTSDRKTGGTNGVRWLENPGKITGQKRPWNNHFIGAQGLEVMFMDLADLDGDGLEDAVVTEYTNQKVVFMKRLNASGLNWKSYSIDIPKAAGRAKAVKVGDINGDGKPDLVLSSNTLKESGKVGLVWMSFIGAPTDPDWAWHELSGPVGYKFDRIELLDLDGDGDLDVLTCEENYGTDSKGLGVIWYENPFDK